MCCDKINWIYSAIKFMTTIFFFLFSKKEKYKWFKKKNVCNLNIIKLDACNNNLREEKNTLEKVIRKIIILDKKSKFFFL